MRLKIQGRQEIIDKVRFMRKKRRHYQNLGRRIQPEKQEKVLHVVIKKNNKKRNECAGAIEFLG